MALSYLISSSSGSRRKTLRRSSFSKRCLKVVKQQRTRIYILRRCVSMLLCWHHHDATDWFEIHDAFLFSWFSMDSPSLIFPISWRSDLKTCLWFAAILGSEIKNLKDAVFEQILHHSICHNIQLGGSVTFWCASRIIYTTCVLDYT